MVKPSVYVTRRWPEAVEAQLAESYNASFNTADKPLDADELRQAIQKFDAVLPTVTDKLGSEVLDVKKPQAKILGNYGVGFSHIHLDSAKSLGLAVTNTPDVLSECTADTAMTLMLMVARRAGEGERELRNGKWTGWRPTQVLAKFNARQVDTIEELLPVSDFVSLHCPGGEENRHMINCKRLNLMKPDAFLINSARGEIIDELALIHALNFGTIGGAALDVFDGEPNITPELMNHDNLVMLPHLGSATREAREAMGYRVLDNLSDFFSGRDPRSPLKTSSRKP